MEKLPRKEHPKPQCMRKNWQNLNGRWNFEIDNARSGEARGLQNAKAKLASKILVPFCPESRLSGIGNRDFMNAVWYQKKITVKEKDLLNLVILHFGAVDYRTKVFVNGIEAGTHVGGYVSFSVDITKYLKVGTNVLTVYAEDDSRDPLIPSGKQSAPYGSKGCYYTRTTGIWQTVWLEYVAKDHIDSFVFDGDIDTGILTAKVSLIGTGNLTMTVSYSGKIMGKASLKKASGDVLLSVTLKEKHIWDLGKGELYDITFTFGKDTVSSYYGLRKIEFKEGAFYLNHRSVFQRLILDQGFYPDGIYTAPTDRELLRDIERSMAMGFNGARPHEKIFEERYLYYCDKKGYMVWGEYPNWGLNHTDPMSIYSILPEWLEEVKRDRNHPSIIGWCPFNETWNKKGRPQYDDVIRMLYRVTKNLDPYRPCIDTSGNYHVETDIHDVHDYIQDPVEFKKNYDTLVTEGTLFEYCLIPKEIVKSSHQASVLPYMGEPVFVSEFGGIRWTKEQEMRQKKVLSQDERKSVSWGYGKDVETREEFKARFKGLCDALLDNPKMFGFCYTQLTDVEQEENGLYTYDRVAKFSPSWVKKVVSRKAAIEK